MSDQTPANKPPRDVSREQAVKPTELQTGKTAEPACGLNTVHRYSIQGLIAIIKDKSHATLAAPPDGERSEKGGSRSTAPLPKQEPEP